MIRTLFFTVLAIGALILIGSIMPSWGYMLIASLLLLGLLFWGLWRILFPGPGPSKFCGNCGHEGPTKKHTRGSLTLEIFLWILFLVPGFLYSVWRHSTRKEVCSECGADHLLPMNSPMAKMTKKQLATAEQSMGS